MSLFLAFVTIIQSFSISLGVGCSTLAVLNFFSAIRDGIIDDTERRMMGVVYATLRVVMVLILISTSILFANEYLAGGFEKVSTLTYSQILPLVVLYVNAILMSFHLVPSTVGPAFQVGSWYTLGTLLALQVLGYTSFTFIQFLLGYATGIILAIGIVNAGMAVMKEKKGT